MKTLVKMLPALIILLPTLLHAEGTLDIDMDEFLPLLPQNRLVRLGAAHE